MASGARVWSRTLLLGTRWLVGGTRTSARGTRGGRYPPALRRAHLHARPPGCVPHPKSSSSLRRSFGICQLSSPDNVSQGVGQRVSNLKYCFDTLRLDKMPASRVEVSRPRPAIMNHFCRFAAAGLRLTLPCLLALTVLATRAAEPSVEARNTDLGRFLPANGNDVFPAAHLLRAWTNGSPKLLWQATVGGGRSSVMEVDGRAYTAGQDDQGQWAICLDPKSGQVRWRHLLSSAKNSHNINGPVATPVVD